MKRLNEAPKPRVSDRCLNGDDPNLNARNQRSFSAMAWNLKIRSDHGAFVVVMGVTPHQGVSESGTQGEGTQIFQLQEA